MASIRVRSEAMQYGAMNLVRASYEGSRVERTYDRKSMGSFAQLNTSPYVQLTFDVELGAGAGAAQAPVYAALLRACGLEESDRAAEVAADHADGTDYVVGDLVSLANLNYECIQAHTSDAGTNDPGTAGGAAFWSLRNYIFPPRRCTSLATLLTNRSRFTTMPPATGR